MPPIAQSDDTRAGPTTATARAAVGRTYTFTPEDRFAEYDFARGQPIERRTVGRATRDSRRETVPVPE